MIGLKWFSLNVTGTAMFRVSQKLKALKQVIRDFSRLNYSDLEKRTHEAHSGLLEAQSKMLQNPSLSNAEHELELHRKWQILSSAEESFFMQRSRVTWLREGDNNTTYFHKMANTRQALNHIHFLFDNDGARIESQQGIHNHSVDYFEKLLGGEQDQSIFTQSDINALLKFRCSAAQQASLDSPFSSEEIKAAFFSLPRNKTSGPDGFSRNSSVVVGR